jgi:hypothetical protein
MEVFMSSIYLIWPIAILIVLTLVWKYADYLIILIFNGKIDSSKKWPNLAALIERMRFLNQQVNIKLYSFHHLSDGIYLIGSNNSRKVLMSETMPRLFSEKEVENFIRAFIVMEKIKYLKLNSFLILLNTLLYLVFNKVNSLMSRLIKNKNINRGIMTIVYWIFSPYFLLLNLLSKKVNLNIYQQIEIASKPKGELNSFFIKYYQMKNKSPLQIFILISRLESKNFFKELSAVI